MWSFRLLLAVLFLTSCRSALSPAVGLHESIRRSCCGCLTFSSVCRPAQVISLSADASVLHVFCFGVWGALPPKLLEQRSALLLFYRSQRCVGHVSHGQWTHTLASTLVALYAVRKTAPFHKLTSLFETVQQRRADICQTLCTLTCFSTN